MSHTPGPWHTEDNKTGGYSVYNFEDRPIASWIAKTDARLIAAAPELLEAAKLAKKYLEPDLVEPGRTVFWRLVDAIAKAEGHDHGDGNKQGQREGER